MEVMPYSIHIVYILQVQELVFKVRLKAGGKV